MIPHPHVCAHSPRDERRAPQPGTLRARALARTAAPPSAPTATRVVPVHVAMSVRTLLQMQEQQHQNDLRDMICIKILASQMGVVSCGDGGRDSSLHILSCGACASALDGECACDARMSVALTSVVSW